MIEQTEWTRELNGICIRKNFRGNYDFFVEWYVRSFPDNKDPNYASEWVDRFLSGTPWGSMDCSRLGVFKTMLEEKVFVPCGVVR